MFDNILVGNGVALDEGDMVIVWREGKQRFEMVFHQSVETSGEFTEELAAFIWVYKGLCTEESFRLMSDLGFDLATADKPDNLN